MELDDNSNPNQWPRGAVSPRAKRPERHDHSREPSAEVRN